LEFGTADVLTWHRDDARIVLRSLWVALVDQASRGCDDRDDALSVIVQKDAGILDLMGFN
jgi:hypothetical protein